MKKRKMCAYIDSFFGFRQKYEQTHAQRERETKTSETNLRTQKEKKIRQVKIVFLMTAAFSSTLFSLVVVVFVLHLTKNCRRQYSN